MSARFASEDRNVEEARFKKFLEDGRAQISGCLFLLVKIRSSWLRTLTPAKATFLMLIS